MTGFGAGTAGMPSTDPNERASSAATSDSPSSALINRRASDFHSEVGSPATASRWRSWSTRSPSRCERISASDGSARSSGFIL